MGKGHAASIEYSVPISYKGSWPPDVSRLAAAGFDSISHSANFVKIVKVHGTDLLGKPNSTTQIAIHKNTIALSILTKSREDEEVAKMRAVLMLLRAMRLIPGIHADLAKLSELILPSLEMADSLLSQPYESLMKKHKDLEEMFYEEQKKNKQLSKISEELAAANIALEKQLEELKERQSKLESLSDEALCELVLDWINTHRGSFNLSSFCKATGVPPARAEEGVEILLKKGALRRVKTGFVQQASLPERQFEKRSSILESARKLIEKAASPPYSSSVKKK